MTWLLLLLMPQLIPIPYVVMDSKGPVCWRSDAGRMVYAPNRTEADCVATILKQSPNVPAWNPTPVTICVVNDHTCPMHVVWHA